MGWLDQLGYNIAPFFGPVGRGIQESVINSRVADLAKQYNDAPDLTRFSAIQTPDNIYDPSKLSELEKLKELKLAKLQAQEAAPIAGRLAKFQAEGNDADPNFTGAEWVKGMMTTPALGGTMSEDEYNSLKSGAVPGGKKGAMPITAFGYNPKTAEYLQDAEQMAQNKGTLARSLGSMDLATLAMNKDLTSGFHQVNQGTNLMDETVKRQFDRSNTEDKLAREKATAEYYYNTPVSIDPADMERFKTGLMRVAGTEDVAKPWLDRFTTLNDPFKNMNEADLTLKAINGDKKAQEVLDRMQERKKQIALDSRTVITSNPMPSRVGLNINGMTEAEQLALDRAIQNGLDPYKVNSRTGKIYAQLELQNPGRDWNALGAQAAFERNAGTMNTKALLNTIDPLLGKLQQAGKILGNSSVPGYNKAVNFVKEATGRPDIVGFNNLRDDVVAEVERGLMGTGVLSDSKYNRAIKNINSAQSYSQLQAAIENTRTVINARLESMNKGPNATTPRQGANAQQKGAGIDLQSAAAAELARRGRR